MVGIRIIVFMAAQAFGFPFGPLAVQGILSTLLADSCTFSATSGVAALRFWAVFVIGVGLIERMPAATTLNWLWKCSGVLPSPASQILLSGDVL
jgi:hypothetical protein